MNTQIASFSGTYVASYVAAEHLLKLYLMNQNPFVVVVTLLDSSEQVQVVEMMFPTASRANSFARHMKAQHPEIVEIEIQYRRIS